MLSSLIVSFFRYLRPHSNSEFSAFLMKIDQKYAERLKLLLFSKLHSADAMSHPAYRDMICDLIDQGYDVLLAEEIASSLYQQLKTLLIQSGMNILDIYAHYDYAEQGLASRNSVKYLYSYIRPMARLAGVKRFSVVTSFPSFLNDIVREVNQTILTSRNIHEKYAIFDLKIRAWLTAIEDEKKYRAQMILTAMCCR